MFDADNMTTEEEILEQGITDVLIRPQHMADMIRFSQGLDASPQEKSLADLVLQVNQKSEAVEEEEAKAEVARPTP